MNCQIKKVREHLEIYIDGKFFCSVDNDKEAEEELEALEQEA